MSVVETLNCKLYWFSKLFQLSIAIPISYTLSSIIFHQVPDILGIIVNLLCCLGAIISGILLRKNNSRNQKQDVVYYTKNDREDILCYSEKRLPVPAFTVNTPPS